MADRTVASARRPWCRLIQTPGGREVHPGDRNADAGLGGPASHCCAQAARTGPRFDPSALLRPPSTAAAGGGTPRLQRPLLSADDCRLSGVQARVRGFGHRHRGLRRLNRSAQQQVFHQRLLHVQPVLGFVPDHDCGPSMTSAVTSSPRCAGRQCMKTASGWATAIISASTHQSAKAFSGALVLGLVAHAGPDVGGHEVRAAHASSGFLNSRSSRYGATPATRGVELVAASACRHADVKPRISAACSHV